MAEWHSSLLQSEVLARAGRIGVRADGGRAPESHGENPSFPYPGGAHKLFPFAVSAGEGGSAHTCVSLGSHSCHIKPLRHRECLWHQSSGHMFHSFPSVSVPLCFCDKVPQIVWCQTNLFLVLKARNLKSNCWQGHGPSDAHR